MSILVELTRSTAPGEWDADLAPDGPPGLHDTLIGREREIADVRARLAAPGCRLLTVTGLAGVGKSALVRAALADRTGTDFVVVSVDLAAAADADGVWTRVAAALRQPQDGDAREAAWTALADRAADRELLLVLDNGDLAARAVAGDLAVLLRRIPRLCVVFTSRIALDIHAERIFPLGPLATGAAGAAGPSAASDAARLFVARLQPHYRWAVTSAADRDGIAEICALLEGVPLAVEEAARAVGALSPRRMLQRIRDGEQLYSRRLVDVPSRHGSMNAALSWGDAALTAGELQLLRRLSVCEAAFDLAVAQQVAGLNWAQTVQGLDALVRKSLLHSVKREGAEPEFRMFRATRRHYRTRLAADPADLAATRARHAAHTLEFALQARQGLRLPKERAYWLELVAERTPDLFAIARLNQEAGDHAAAARMLLALEEAWTVHDLLGTAGALLDGSLAALTGAEGTQATEAAARWALTEGDWARAEVYAERLGRGLDAARAAALRAELMLGRGDAVGALQQAEFALAGKRAPGSTVATARVLRTLAAARAAVGRRQPEEPLVKAARGLLELGEPRQAALTLAALAVAQRGHARARAGAGEAVELLLAHAAPVRDVRAVLVAAAGTVPAGGEAYRRLGALADRIPARGDDVPQGAQEPAVPDGHGGVLLAARAALAEAAREEAEAAPAGGLERLTHRQLQVAELVAEGMTNRQIARALELSEWTVVNHLRQVMQRLDCPSRVHVARIVQGRATARLSG
ncbi:LuxR C-terminal-related transcriptional regulator [Streptomyces sp. NBC_01808]|uniref:ATP-binding protein n=1 Tax=Streptomyces sp. NBC_01808 TaxID=2975947 RepID=UPI002DD92E47|nr:LuxR C-terminal-related transcriptional regulator [Streptomyces sp. NBC_01808]WSA37706.1 LuxR C-terminal-related transcriptional regulator [Streptomyces sp. NBC_01808]